MSDLWGEAETIVLGADGRRSGLAGFVAAPSRTMGGFTPWGGDRPRSDPIVAPMAAVDPNAIRAEAFAAGLAEGRRTVELEIAAERAAIGRLAETLQSLEPEPPAALAQVLAETVKRLVAEIVGAAPVDETLLAGRTMAAAQLVIDEAGPCRLHVSPGDVARLAGTHPNLEMVADPALPQGAIRVETGAGWIEDGPELRLKRLRQALDRIGGSS